MARIQLLNREERNIKEQSAVEATYSVSECKGETLFQITTYGSQRRKDKGAASQIISFDREMAIRLTAILKEEFQLE